jgi:hypothetical protein
MKYTLFGNGETKNIVVVDDRDPSNVQMHSATDQHPAWDRIIQGVMAEDDAVYKLFDVGAVAAEAFERLSDRVTISGGNIYFDNEKMDGALEEQISRFVEAGSEADWLPLINFYEKVMTNLNEHTREQLYRWLNQQQISITPEGDFIAYKGVKPRKIDDNYEWESISRGRAIVDGKPYDGSIPNDVGAVVEMPRGEVQHDPKVGCHTGLHAGTWKYAKDFSQGAVLRVAINPRDVVSVPTDCNDAKLRTCRYTVLEVTDKENLETVYRPATWGNEIHETDNDYEDEDSWYEEDDDDTWY